MQQDTWIHTVNVPNLHENATSLFPVTLFLSLTTDDTTDGKLYNDDDDVTRVCAALLLMMACG